MSTAALALHRDALVVDGHVHITNAVFNQGIDPWQVQATGTFDYARARQGGLDAAIEHVFVDDEYNRYNYTVKQACRLIETFYRVLDAHGDNMALALSAADIRRSAADGKLAVVLALEGGFDMEGDVDVLRLFHRLGVRLIQFTNHEMSNALTDAHAGEQKWDGISAQGRAVIREMNRLGIVIDIAHASHTAQRQIIEVSRAPVVNSHTGLHRFCASTATLADDTLRALAAKGGMIGLHSAGWLLRQQSLDWGYSVFPHHFPHPPSPPKPPLIRPPLGDNGEFIAQLDAQMRERWIAQYGYGEPWRTRQAAALQRGAPLPTVRDWARLADYVVRLVGDAHLGIGLDLMAGGHWLRDFDATAYPRLTEALMEQGLSETAIRHILGENWLRVLDAAKVGEEAACAD